MFRNPTTDLLVVVLIVLLFFGPKRLPTLGRSLGQGMREFKDSISGKSSDDDGEDRPELTQATASPVTGEGDKAPAGAGSTPDAAG
jgi:sec-independent protein translocase protein TatA